jgi:hypothetical protein
VLLQQKLLTQAPGTLADKLQLLQHLTEQQEGYVVRSGAVPPAVSTLSAESVREQWDLLQRCMEACCCSHLASSKAPKRLGVGTCGATSNTQVNQRLRGTNVEGSMPPSACCRRRDNRAHGQVET